MPHQFPRSNGATIFAPLDRFSSSKSSDLQSLWRAFLFAMDDLVELEDEGWAVEDFSIAYVLYRQLRRRGLAFDSSFIGFMEELNREAFGCDDDPDHDDADLRTTEDELSCDHHHEAEAIRAEMGEDYRAERSIYECGGVI